MAANKTSGDQLRAVWFAAGTAALMACVERAVVVSLFAHWRVWAFLALNLLLLAILFMTSKSQIQSSTKVDEEELSVAAENVKPAARGGDAPSEKKDEREEGEEQISEEELNKRAEAFIAMFRQHLVSDAKNFRTRGNGHRFSHTAKVY